jgi:CelD/BcsL family acetyltransferase involved in cellulose biosynthesis
VQGRKQRAIKVSQKQGKINEQAILESTRSKKFFLPAETIPSPRLERDPNMKVEVLDKGFLVGDLAGEWKTLLAKSPHKNPFLTPIWNEIWLNHFGHLLDVKVLLFRSSEGSLGALGSFVNSNKGEAGRGLTLLGSSDVWDYRDLIITAGLEDQVFTALAGFFREGQWDYLEFNGISEISPTARFCPSIMQSSGFKVTQEVEEVAVYVNVPPTWEIFLEQLNSKDRHELRRKMRRMEKETTFELFRADEPISLADKLETFFDLHRKSRQDKAQFMTREMESYFRDIANRFQERGWLNLTFLRIGGIEVATFFSFDFERTEYVFNSGYDPEFSRFSPGIVLAALCIRRAIEKGVVRFNFLRGREDYKYRLGGKEEKIYRIRVEKV